MIVVKFGGTSVGSASSLRRVAEIVRSRIERRPVIVVSALSGVTDMLYRMVEAASIKDSRLIDDCAEALRNRHFSLVRELMMPGDGLEETLSIVGKLIDGAVATALASLPDDHAAASIISTGELMSSRIVGAFLCRSGINTLWADARKMMIVSGDALKAEPDTAAMNRRIPAEILPLFGFANLRQSAPLVPEPALSAERRRAERPVLLSEQPVPVQAVITQGFICADAAGNAAILGRGGSDYSASLIGAALDADAVEIWTDVDGVRTADPRRVGVTACLGRISYEEAAEMAHFGAKVLHPLTLEPVSPRNIPVYVFNTANPDGEHSVILHKGEVDEAVKSVSYKDNVQVLSIAPCHPMNRSLFLNAVFDAFSDTKVAVDMVSIGRRRLYVTVDDLQKNLGAAISRMEEFATVSVDGGKAQISAIGSSAACMTGILKMNFAPLRDSKVSMVCPGISVVNVSFVIDKDCLDDTLRLTHECLLHG